MSDDADFRLAILLQSELNELENEPKKIQKIPSKTIWNSKTNIDLNATQNLVHPDWEMIDPTPDILSLFGAFDTKFFQGKLRCVELEWSKKMYSCAGICYQRTNRVGKQCIIRLSEPLLKLRSRKNLIETLLHEMIHAYLFIKNIREGNGGHGPNFQKIMININRTAGTNITVYHTYYDEVNLYKTHVWRCNGICQHRKPFFGYVRRTSNRAPGPNDLWWRQHQAMCGGYYKKISEPDRPPTKRKTSAKDNATNGSNTIQRIDSPKWGFSNGGSGNKTATSGTGSYTKTIKPSTNARNKSTSSSPGIEVPASPRFGNLANVVSLRDLNDSSSSEISTSPPRRPIGPGRVLGTVDRSGHTPSQSLREIWSKRYPSTAASPSSPQHVPEEIPTKRPKIEIQNAKSEWHVIDDDLEIKDEQPTVIILDDSIIDSPKREKPDSAERQRNIKQEILDSLNDGEKDSDIELIDDEFDDDFVDAATAISDTSVIDDFFGEDTLMKDFNEINNVIMSDAENKGKPEREIIRCPVCQERMARQELPEHLDGCLGIRIEILPGKRVNSNVKSIFPSTSKEKYNPRRDATSTKSSTEADEYNQRIYQEMREEQQQRNTVIERLEPNETITLDGEDNNMVKCPICTKDIVASQINDHLDLCLANEN